MAPWSLSRKLVWGSREVKGWSGPEPVAEGWAQVPARGRRWSLAAPENRVRTSCALLPPIAPCRPPARAPGGRRHSLPCPRTGTNSGPGKENLPLLSLPGNGRQRGAERKVRRNSQDAERKVGRSSQEQAQAVPPAPQGRAVSTESGQTSGSSQCDSASSAEDEEFTHERIIDWLLGVNACLYQEPGTSQNLTLNNTEEDTSIKIVHGED